MARKRILFVVPWDGSSFIERDLDILQKHFVVSKTTFNVRNPLSLLSLLVAILGREVDGVFVWFAFWWTAFIVLASKFSGVRTILVPSGSDVARCPEIDYGEMRFLRARILGRFGLNHCDMALPVSVFMKNKVLASAKPKKMKVIYNGINVRQFKPRHGLTREELVITVGSINDLNTRCKRFDLFIESARHLPNTRFMIIGPHLDSTVKILQSEAPPNVSFPGYESQDKLVESYSQAKVYVQLSHDETFGVALAEAMACECVPVVVSRGALPEVVGDTGYYAPYEDPEGIAEAIEEALGSTKGSEARGRILEFFSLEIRERELISTLREILNE